MRPAAPASCVICCQRCFCSIDSASSSLPQPMQIISAGLMLLFPHALCCCTICRKHFTDCRTSIPLGPVFNAWRQSLTQGNQLSQHSEGLGICAAASHYVTARCSACGTCSRVVIRSLQQFCRITVKILMWTLQKQLWSVMLMWMDKQTNAVSRCSVPAVFLLSC